MALHCFKGYFNERVTFELPYERIFLIIFSLSKFVKTINSPYSCMKVSHLFCVIFDRTDYQALLTGEGGAGDK